MYRVKPNDERRKAQLAALQADDKDIEDILLTASHVALYELKTESTGPAWRKTDVEGCLYVLKRRSRPKTMILIKNQSDSDEGDFSQSLEGKVEFEVKESTIFYKVGDRPTVRGLWFASKDSLNQFAALVEKNAHTEDAGKALMDMLARPSQPKPVVRDDDAISLLKEKLKIGAPPAPPAPPAVHASQPAPAVQPPLPPAPGLPAPHKNLPDTVTIRKSDLRVILADLLSSDEIVNRIFASLAARSQS